MLDRITEFLIFGFVPLVVGMLAVPDMSSAAEKTLKGEMMYRERIALPPNAVLSVQLVEISAAAAPVAVIAEDHISPVGQVPITFEIVFDPQLIKPDMTYTLRARISAGNHVAFISDTPHPLDPLADARQTIVLKLVAREHKVAEIFARRWLIGYTELTGVTPAPPAVFAIHWYEGNAVFFGRCSIHSAKAMVDGSTIAIRETNSLPRVCTPDIAAKEKALFQALFDSLAKATFYRIESGKLVMTDKDGRDILHFNAQD